MWRGKRESNDTQVDVTGRSTATLPTNTLTAIDAIVNPSASLSGGICSTFTGANYLIEDYTY